MNIDAHVNLQKFILKVHGQAQCFHLFDIITFTSNHVTDTLMAV